MVGCQEMGETKPLDRFGPGVRLNIGGSDFHVARDVRFVR